MFRVCSLQDFKIGCSWFYEPVWASDLGLENCKDGLQSLDTQRELFGVFSCSFCSKSLPILVLLHIKVVWMKTLDG